MDVFGASSASSFFFNHPRHPRLIHPSSTPRLDQRFFCQQDDSQTGPLQWRTSGRQETRKPGTPPHIFCGIKILVTEARKPYETHTVKSVFFSDRAWAVSAGRWRHVLFFGGLSMLFSLLLRMMILIESMKPHVNKICKFLRSCIFSRMFEMCGLSTKQRSGVNFHSFDRSPISPSQNRLNKTQVWKLVGFSNDLYIWIMILSPLSW